MDSELNPSGSRLPAGRVLYVLVVLGILALAMNGIFGSHGLIVAHRMKLQERQLQQNIQKLNQENQALAGQVRELKSDPNAIERVAREQMGLVKPGDLVFKLPPKSPGQSGAATPTLSEPLMPQAAPAAPPHR
ncbi:MAG TPA: septum formation initiator family protein [Candidatus Acidoferrales bacterium]|nr:septum formation initiator family protein [Candidatus Acidoferrales bacterium]